MNAWFRYYHEALDDPKVQGLTPLLFRYWVNILSLSCRYSGYLPQITDIAFGLRMTENEAAAHLEALREAKLIDSTSKGLRPHAWDKRQFQSDHSTDRVKRFRKRSKKQHETINETDQTQNRTDTDTEQNRKPPLPLLALGEHGFAKMTASKKQKLEMKMNGAAEQLITEFDLWVAAAPNAKAGGIRRQDRDAYATIQAWYSRRVREGRLTQTRRLPMVEQQDAQREAWDALSAKINR
jgi:hypothetical protein